MEVPAPFTVTNAGPLIAVALIGFFAFAHFTRIDDVTHSLFSNKSFTCTVLLVISLTTEDLASFCKVKFISFPYFYLLIQELNKSPKILGCIVLYYLKISQQWILITYKIKIKNVAIHWSILT